jgi:hypothetical protein
MNFLHFISFVSILLSCNSDNVEFVRKEISNNDIAVKWYFYSYITNTSPDIVEVSQNGVKKEIFKAEWVILNVTLKEDTITLRLVEPSKGIVFTKKVEHEVFGYQIKLDTTGTYDEMELIPDGIKRR